MSARKTTRPTRRARRPMVGITPDAARFVDRPSRYELNCAYSDAVLLAQGLPLVLPYSESAQVVEAYLEEIDGLLLTGGAFDIDPAEYGELRREGCGPAKPERTAFEKALLAGALERGLPVLGVCGGMQLINVWFGGSLYQDIPREVSDPIVHEQKTDKREPSHPVSIRRGTRLGRAAGEGQLMVNSTHHQAVRHLGENLIDSAHSEDGLIEAVESTQHRFVLGVQWHPELLLLSAPLNLGIYRAFVKACAKVRG